MNIIKRKLIGAILLLSFTTIASAQLKIGYILSERIRSEYEEFKEAESQLQLEYRKVQFEFDQRVKKLDSLKQDYEVKRLMSLDKGESIKQEIEQTEKQIQTYQAEKVGLKWPIFRKIEKILRKCSKTKIFWEIRISPISFGPFA